MSKNENIHSEWGQLVENWRGVWDEWSEVMDRITLAFSKSENPLHEDLDLEESLKEQVDSASAKMEKFKANLINRR